MSALPTVRKGSQDKYVSYLQNLLNARLPSETLWVDGIFGLKTEFAVRKYQMMKFLAVDGVVGAATWASLEAGPPRIQKRPPEVWIVTTRSSGL